MREPDTSRPASAAHDNAAPDPYSAFTSWYGDLLRWVLAPAIEKTGAAPATDAVEAWLWSIGAPERCEHEPTELARRLAAMPALPGLHPSDSPTAQALGRVEALSRGPVAALEWEADMDERRRVFEEVRRQGVRLQEFARTARAELESEWAELMHALGISSRR